jgi:hypothetical protein
MSQRRVRDYVLRFSGTPCGVRRHLIGREEGATLKKPPLFKPPYDFACTIERLHSQIAKMEILLDGAESSVEKKVINRQIQRLKDKASVVTRAVACPSENNVEQALIMKHRDLAPSVSD